MRGIRAAAAAIVLALLLAAAAFAETSAPTPSPVPTPEASPTPAGWFHSDFDDELLKVLTISQRDLRYNTDEYRFFGDRFVINGCGPASVVNGMNVAFGIEDQELTDRILLEIMVLNAGLVKPEKTNITFTHMDRLVQEVCDSYPALTEMKARVDEVRWVEKSLTKKSIMKAVNSAAGSAVIMGRINLSQGWLEIIDTADELNAMGLGDAVFTVTRMSAGTETTATPFCMGENGHFITVCIQVREFIEQGTIYVIDSYPRAVRGESLNEIYDKRYYFAANNKLTAFRTNYDAWHLSPTIVKCSPKESVKAEMKALRAEAGKSANKARTYRNFRRRLASRISTYGSGTLFLRIR